MKITIIGTGYVGLVTGTCLADVGNDVLCFDVDARKITQLQQGHSPLYEPGLEELVQHNLAAKRLRFTADPEESVAHGKVQMIAVGTPADEDGSADLSHVLAAARTIGRYMLDYKIIVDKSTVPVGTADKVKNAVNDELSLRRQSYPFSVVSNPEFLKEGAAVDDFMRPDRVILGADDEQAVQALRTLYAPFQRNHDRIMVMDIRSAELTKYAANAMLATRISFMNELANLAELLQADIEQVRRGIGADPRIGYHFLYAGCGFGGSCFPKDLKALQRTAAEQGTELQILAAVERVNELQKSRLLQKIDAQFGKSLHGKTLAIWGLAFKPNTDDMREAPSRSIVAGLLERGAQVAAYDPVAMNEAKRIFGEKPKLHFAPSPYAATEGADALVIVTEWKEFRSPDFARIKAGLKNPFIFDGRNLYEPATVRSAGLRYFAIGRI